MQRCRGTLNRRDVIQAGLMGAAGFGLADLLQVEALARPLGSANAKSMIVLWLWGGPSHMETFDLKPDAPSEYRGEFQPIPTNVSGIEISEYLPRLSQLADKFALVRSLHHDSNGHVNSTHTMMTGYSGEAIETPPFQPKYPDVRAVIHHLQGPQHARVPAQVA